MKKWLLLGGLAIGGMFFAGSNNAEASHYPSYGGGYYRPSCSYGYSPYGRSYGYGYSPHRSGYGYGHGNYGYGNYGQVHIRSRGFRFGLHH